MSDLFHRRPPILQNWLQPKSTPKASRPTNIVADEIEDTSLRTRRSGVRKTAARTVFVLPIKGGMVPPGRSLKRFRNGPAALCKKSPAADKQNRSHQNTTIRRCIASEGKRESDSQNRKTDFLFRWHRKRPRDQLVLSACDAITSQWSVEHDRGIERNRSCHVRIRETRIHRFYGYAGPLTTPRTVSASCRRRQQVRTLSRAASGKTPWVRSTGRKIDHSSANKDTITLKGGVYPNVQLSFISYAEVEWRSTRTHRAESPRTTCQRANTTQAQICCAHVGQDTSQCKENAQRPTRCSQNLLGSRDCLILESKKRGVGSRRR